jgi:predicted transcriptional regulator
VCLLRFYAAQFWTALDIGEKASYASSMELQLPDRQAAELANLSSRTGRSPSDLVVEAVDRLLEQETRFDEQVQLALDQIARGEFLEEEEMDARVARMLRP